MATGAILGQSIPQELPYQVSANTNAQTNISPMQIRNISAGTSDLTAGSSPLATGQIYLVYEG